VDRFIEGFKEGVFKKEAHDDHIHADGNKERAVIGGDKGGNEGSDKTGNDGGSENPGIPFKKHQGNKIGTKTEIDKDVHDKFQNEERKKQGQGG
jgi:hypothetical protein